MLLTEQIILFFHARKRRSLNYIAGMAMQTLKSITEGNIGMSLPELMRVKPRYLEAI